MIKEIRTLTLAAMTASSIAAVIGATVPSVAKETPAAETTTTNPMKPGGVDNDHYQDGLKKWTPRDSVAVRYFAPEQIEVSPDGERFFYVSYRGDLTCDCDVYELVVYSSRGVLHALASQPKTAPAPLATLVRRSFGHETLAILFPHWETDSEFVTFQGVDAKGILQLYRYDVRRGEIKPMTGWEYQPESTLVEGDTILANIFVPGPPPASLVYPYQVVTRNELRNAFLSDDDKSRRLATFVVRNGKAPWEVKDTSPQLGVDPWFTKDGVRAVASRFPKEWPSHWDSYDRMSRYVGNKTDITRFILIDAERGFARPVFDAPAGDATLVGAERKSDIFPEALWTADQKHVVLVNTALPFNAENTPEHSRMAYVVGYDTVADRWKVIEPLESYDSSTRSTRRVVQVGWLKAGRELLIRHESDGKSARGTVYTLENREWVGRQVDPSVMPSKPEAMPRPTLAGGLSVRLHQSANDPPMIVASDGKRELTLTQPDPVLAGVFRAPSTHIEWTTPSGRTQAAGLLMPRNTPGKRVPLIIQAYRYEPERFNPDGPYRHIYAAQSLVARGMAVVNLTIPVMDMVASVPVSPRELSEFAARVESLVRSLADRGIADPERVGLIGFSRAGFNVFYQITHPGTIPPAAAIIDDAYSGTYFYYIFQRALTKQPSSFDRLYEGSFWQNKKGWLENEPSFNLDRVSAPTLFATHGEGNVIHAAEILGAFQLSNRPHEYVVFPSAKHQLHTPSQRLASFELSTDWMSFWLLGQEDPDRQKAGQYARWRAIRLQEENRKKAEREVGR